MIRLILSGIVGAALFAGCSDDASTIRLDQSDSGNEVSVDAGDQIEIILDSNPSTGFSWVIDQGTTDVANLVTRTFEAGDTDLIGAAGTETFVFEALGPDAGVIRLVYIRPFDDPPIPERIVEYIVLVDGATWTRDSTGPVSTSVASADDNSDAESIGVDALFDGNGPRTAVVEGFVLIDEASARLCEVLMESFPPQCGGLSVVIANPTGLGSTILTEAQGISWTERAVALSGRFDGFRLVLDTDADVVEPTTADEALITAFLAHALAPTAATADALPFADDVTLGLGTENLTVKPRSELADPAAWSLDVEEYAGFGGPFSALDVVASDGNQPSVLITVGAHAHCAGPPRPAPAGFGDLRRVSIQPEAATSCIEWWTVDFFISDLGEVHAVTLDLFGP